MEDAVGNITSWLRRFVMGALEHQHAPLPQDEDEPYRFRSEQDTPWWLKWSSTAPTGYSNYAPTLQAESDYRMAHDEERQMDEAMRRSEQERRRSWSEEEEERERREMERAMEMSKREAEEKARREAEEAAAVEAAAAAAAAAAVPSRDLIVMEEADLLGLGDSAGAVVPYDPTANDDAIARALQKSLLDDDFGPSETDLLAKVSANAPPPSAANGEVDLLALVDAPSGGLDSQSGALVAVNPNKTPFRPSAASQGICGGCGRSIDYGRFLNCMGKAWHPQCFKCKGCSLPISERDFNAVEADPYHQHCYKERFHPKCIVCKDYIPIKEGGVIEFRTVAFWNDKHCPVHAADGTPLCASCLRPQPRGADSYAALDDGRKLCLQCVETVVVDTNDCTPLYVSVQQFFEAMGMKVTQEIPLHCVEIQALNEMAEEEKKMGHHIHSVVRGLCLYEEHTVQVVTRQPGANVGTIFGGVGHSSVTVSRHCEVTAILVLYGLPQLLTGQILAHELMHAWMKLDGGFSSLPEDVEEGLCQVMAHLWLQAQLGALSAAASQPGATAADTFKSKLAEFCMHQIAMDSSPVYGEGFRRAYTATVQHGLTGTLNHVRSSKSLPQ